MQGFTHRKWMQCAWCTLRDTSVASWDKQKQHSKEKQYYSSGHQTHLPFYIWLHCANQFSVWTWIFLSETICDWGIPSAIDRAITHARFSNHTLAKQLAINNIDRAPAIPTALRKFALTSSGRLRIVLVSSLTLEVLSDTAKQSNEVLALCPANPSFEELELPVQKSFLLKSDSLQCKLSQDNKNALLWSGEATWQWIPITTNQHNFQSTNPGISEQKKMHRSIFCLVFLLLLIGFGGFFECQSLSWKITSDRAHQPDCTARNIVIGYWKADRQDKALCFYGRIFAKKCCSQYSITKLLSWTIKTTISKESVETFLEVRL